MKRKISWIEPIIILCVVILFVSGWKFWYKPDKNLEITPVPPIINIEAPLPAPIDMDKEYNLSLETIEIKYFLKESPDEPYKEETLNSSNNFALLENRPLFPAVPILGEKMGNKKV